VESVETTHVLCHTDPGNDIDDEMAIGDMVRYFLTHSPKTNIHLTISVKTKNVDRLLAYGIKPFTGLDLCPDFNYDNIIPLDFPKILTVTFKDGTVMLPSTYKPHYILSIAPCLDSVITDANLVNLRGFSHQGLPGRWNGFNDNGSIKMITSMLSKGVHHMITTPFESFENPFCLSTFVKYNIPESVWEQIARDAFKMIIGRMPPTVPVSVLPMAESLVNIPYAESLGKPGTNSRLAIEIRSRFTGTPKEISPALRASIYKACINYVDSLIEAAKPEGVSSPIKHYDQTITSVYTMTIALAEIGMPSLDNSGTRLIYSSDGDLADKYPEAFEEFKKIGIYTPPYDFDAVKKFYTLLHVDGVF